MATEIWREFDPNLDIPEGLKNARYKPLPSEIPNPDTDYDFQQDTLSDDESDSGDGYDGKLSTPSFFNIVSQTVRTAANGQQVVDVVIEVEDIEGAKNYEFRLTKV